VSGGHGTLTAIGLGPGDPELITLKGLRLLREARIVFAPVRSEGARSYALELAWPHLDLARQEVASLLYPMTLDQPPDEGQWRFNARRIATRLADGSAGAFLTEGDPLLYSTFIPTLLALRDEFPGLPIQVVPGVSSVTAAAALAQVPLARLDERLAVIPATAPDAALREALGSFETVVLLKVAARFERILDLLDSLGRLDGALLVERVGTPRERVVRDLRALRGRRPDYFSLVIVRGG
jgi:precorrin-2/cobalt-factor-2 C20-methyltransferase